MASEALTRSIWDQTIAPRPTQTARPNSCSSLAGSGFVRRAGRPRRDRRAASEKVFLPSGSPRPSRVRLWSHRAECEKLAQDYGSLCDQIASLIATSST